MATATQGTPVARQLKVTTECKRLWWLRLLKRLYPAYLFWQVRHGRLTPDQATQKYADFVIAGLRVRVRGAWRKIG